MLSQIITVSMQPRAIQTFKAHFISDLATTNSEFPHQLWDCLTPQVINTLNMLHPSHLDLSMLAYEAVHGPYNWNHFPLVPPGHKAVIYKAPESRGSWASWGTNAWYVGPSLNYYQCNHYFVPKTQAYCVSDSAKLFPQHCQVPFLMWNKHLQEVVNELVTTLRDMLPNKQGCVISLITKKLVAHTPDARQWTLMHANHKWLLPRSDLHWVPYIPPPEQRVERVVQQRVNNEGVQWVGKDYINIPALTDYQCPSYHDRTQSDKETDVKGDKKDACQMNVEQHTRQRPPNIKY